ncbi:CrcB protein [Kitasatospora gansuensis]|uniref:Fluoride-specific ion channel FluC n=1 Tax=Kitasatospora gansuensis TaxID=258050 RepID=A0A7W7SD26_9ACTN|nr:CrcB family protein [Kitasatospora gansuensis]MBB4948047.1 CrcB protein [Kitasatospora gansuensis]
MNWLLVAAGAAVGAPLRYLTDLLLRARYGAGFPWGTLAVNVGGSLLLGVVAGVCSARGQLLLGTGLCGALTTYSTFSYDLLRLTEGGGGGGARGRAAGYLLATLVAGIGAAWVGAGLAGVL